MIPGLVKNAVVLGVGFVLGDVFHAWKAQRSAHRVRRLRHGSLSTPGATIVVVTTASLPWRTGTSINPLLRAAHLTADPTRKVVLAVPWLPPAEQPLIFPEGVTFDTPEQQAEYLIGEMRQRSGLPCSASSVEIVFYGGRYFPALGSILPTEDITTKLPHGVHVSVILEEPEHLTWLQHKTRWTDKFDHVVGIMHTNYLAYVREGQATGALNAAALYRINRWMCRLHCHKVIKLSDAVQKLPRQVTCNVHGVAGAFLDVGRALAALPEPRFTKGAYFIGKAVWGKGYRELLTLLAYNAERSGEKNGGPPVDIIGSGEDLEAIKDEAERLRLPLRFLGAADHLAQAQYQVFLNPSTSDVVATTTAEALAMGKWVVVQDIPCNAFFKQFPNCLMYSDPAGFCAALQRALAEEPSRLDEETLGKLSWEAATERLLQCSEIAPAEWPSGAEERYARTLWTMYRSVAGFKALRDALGVTSTTGEEPEGDDVVLEEEGEDADDLDWLFGQSKEAWA